MALDRRQRTTTPRRASAAACGCVNVKLCAPGTVMTAPLLCSGAGPPTRVRKRIVLAAHDNDGTRQVTDQALRRVGHRCAQQRQHPTAATQVLGKRRPNLAERLVLQGTCHPCDERPPAPGRWRKRRSGQDHDLRPLGIASAARTAAWAPVELPSSATRRGPFVASQSVSATALATSASLAGARDVRRCPKPGHRAGARASRRCTPGRSAADHQRTQSGYDHRLGDRIAHRAGSQRTYESGAEVVPVRLDRRRRTPRRSWAAVEGYVAAAEPRGGCRWALMRQRCRGH